MATEKSLHKICKTLNIINAHNYFKTRKKSILERVNLETYRILKCLDLPISLKKGIIKKFMNFWDALNPGSKFRNLEILLPITIFYTLKSNHFPFNEKELLQKSKISNKEFNKFKQVP